MAAYLSFLCIYFNWTYWPHFGLNSYILPMAARLERLIGIETKKYKIRSPLWKRSITHIFLQKRRTNVLKQLSKSK